MATLEQYYRNLENKVQSSTKEYNALQAREKMITQASSTPLVRGATDGVTALELYTSRVKAKTVAAAQIEVLARSVVTAVYGVQCASTVLSKAVQTNFTPLLHDPKELDVELVEQLENCVVVLNRISKFLYIVSNACTLITTVSAAAKKAVSSAVAEIDGFILPEPVKALTAANDYKDEAQKEIARIVALYSQE